MKKITLFATTIFAFLFINTYAQDDAKAKAILDELSAKTKAYSSIKATFTYNLKKGCQGQ